MSTRTTNRLTAGTLALALAFPAGAAWASKPRGDKPASDKAATSLPTDENGEKIIPPALQKAIDEREDQVTAARREAIRLLEDYLRDGRYPAELFATLQLEGLMGDDEEYWPFEGEYWSDEYENYK